MCILGCAQPEAPTSSSLIAGKPVALSLLKAESDVRLMPPLLVAITRLLSSSKLRTASSAGKRSAAGRPSACSHDGMSKPSASNPATAR